MYLNDVIWGIILSQDFIKHMLGLRGWSRRVKRWWNIGKYWQCCSRRSNSMQETRFSITNYRAMYIIIEICLSKILGTLCKKGDKLILLPYQLKAMWSYGFSECQRTVGILSIRKCVQIIIQITQSYLKRKTNSFLGQELVFKEAG